MEGRGGEGRGGEDVARSTRGNELQLQQLFCIA